MSNFEYCIHCQIFFRNQVPPMIWSNESWPPLENPPLPRKRYAKTWLAMDLLIAARHNSAHRYTSRGASPSVLAPHTSRMCIPIPLVHVERFDVVCVFAAFFSFKLCVQPKLAVLTRFYQSFTKLYKLWIRRHLEFRDRTLNRFEPFGDLAHGHKDLIVKN